MNNNRQKSCSHRYKTYSPCRDQYEIQHLCLNDLIPDDHRARRIWTYVETINSDPCFDQVRSMYGGLGQPTTCPKVLLALWLYAYTEGVNSGRKLEELCKSHDGFRWITGGVPINRTMLSRFRASNTAMFHQLLTNGLAIMVHAGLLTSEDMCQDGTRLQAAAGFATYRREDTLRKLLKTAEEYVREVEQISKEEAAALGAKKMAAMKQAAEEKKDKLNSALKELEQHRADLERNRKRRRKGKPSSEELRNVRASHVDPSARKMKMGDGGYRIAYNVQFVTSGQSRVIVGAHVVNTLDSGTMPIAAEQVIKRLAKIGLPIPANWVADSAYSSKEDIDQMANLFPDVTVVAPAKVNKNVDPKEPKNEDSEAVADWRKRLDTLEFKNIYSQRCSTTEFSNMQTKRMGMNRLMIRGLQKVTSSVLLYAIAQNMMRYWDLISNTTV